ncbi:MAG: glycerol-3-phosphate dehydrogenase [Candidatus Methylomirabilales bacterium]
MKQRNEIFDLFVVGGGINGVGIARDAAGRGLKIALCDQGDLGGATSWTSTKLIHGGLRYLEHREFRLVRESLAEREVLLKNAPHLVRPLRFVLPHVPELRPAWMIRAGLFLYDHLSWRNSLPGSKRLDLRSSSFGGGLRAGFRQGFAYSDCLVDDARLVIVNARDASARSAKVMVRKGFAGAEVVDGIWQVHLVDSETGERSFGRARALVNVAGPWVAKVRSLIKGVTLGKRIRLIKGSHIVVPRLYNGEHAYILQNDDGRLVFVIPFEGLYSLIGSTEVEVQGEPGSFNISDEEVNYLCRAVGRYLSREVRPYDVVWSFAGLRPLFGDNEDNLSAITRDYEVELDTVNGTPVLTVYGGKISTYRRLAELVLEKLTTFFPDMKSSWTDSRPLPGGDIPNGDFDTFVREVAGEYSRLPQELVQSLARRYGTLCREVLGGARNVESLGQHFGAGLYAREVDYLINHEWARTADDILWRRTKAGLHMSQDERTTVADYLSSRLQPAPGRTV